MGLGYQAGDNPVILDLAGFNNADVTTITIKVDAANSAKIFIIPPLPAPAFLKGANSQGKTRLTWLPSAGAASYRIYARSPGASDFSLIGSTASTNFLANDAWLLDSAAMPTVYVTVAVGADGATSFSRTRLLIKQYPLKSQACRRLTVYCFLLNNYKRRDALRFPALHLIGLKTNPAPILKLLLVD